MHKYSNDSELFKRIPKAHPKLCQSRDVLEQPDPDDFPRMNELIVLERIQDYFTEGDKEIPTLGLIFTSQALFGNVKKAVEAQGTSLAMSTDGTYRIHCLGWTLVDAGGISVEWETTEHVHRFRPWLYMFVRTECSLAYERMFATLVTCAKRFFDINVKVATCRIDHSSAIASALKTVWPEVAILSCWEHLLAQARKKRSRIVNSSIMIEYCQSCGCFTKPDRNGNFKFYRSV
ncbi:unnamed protein product [Phytophthora lilii]|uniref:Unnamed protein product n=1 Tax=Phytophthora lilii TaxID=2077276 RepID=A0A9W6X7G2_9STRA|nr:unnamed protein product [Phytophthora lilii]